MAQTQADLWKLAHDAAAKTLEMTSAADVEQARLDAFKGAGFTSALDYESFTTFFGDARIVLSNFAKQPLRSALAEQKVS